MVSQPIAMSRSHFGWLIPSMFSDYSECSSMLTWKIQSFYMLTPVLYWFLQGSQRELTKSIAFSSKKWSPNEPARANLGYPSPCLICFTRPTRIKRALSCIFSQKKLFCVSMGLLQSGKHWFDLALLSESVLMPLAA